MIQFFPYMTVVDDFEYYPAAASARQRITEHVADPIVGELVSTLRSLTGIDMLDELIRKEHVGDPIASRHVQMFVMVALGRIAEMNFGTPSARAGYCAGIFPGLLLSGAIDPQRFLQLMPALDGYMGEMFASFVERDITSVTIDFARADLSSEAINALVRQAAERGVHVKDERSAVSWEMIGERSHVSQWVDDLARSHRIAAGPLRKDTIAHMPCANSATFDAGLKDVAFDKVSVPIISSAGLVVQPGQPAALAKTILRKTLFEPIRTARYMTKLNELDDDILFIGSSAVFAFLIERTTFDSQRVRLFSPEPNHLGLPHLW